MTNHEKQTFIAQQLGGSIKEVSGGNGYRTWKFDRDNLLNNVLGNHMILENSMRFDKDWDWIIPAITELSKQENKSLMVMLLGVGGAKCNSLSELFNSLYEYLVKKEKLDESNKNNSL